MPALLRVFLDYKKGLDISAISVFAEDLRTTYPHIQLRRSRSRKERVIR